jgi:hypothetical protein
MKIKAMGPRMAQSVTGRVLAPVADDVGHVILAVSCAGGLTMSIRHLGALIAAAAVYLTLFTSVVSCLAGPCTPEFERVRAAVEAMAAATAAAGPAGRQSAAAMTHHQPTPGSIADAASKFGDVARSRRAQAALADARMADGAGDRGACEQALSDLRREIDH